MSANIVLKKTIDHRVDPSSAKFAHHDFIVGSSATVWQTFNPSSSSVSTNEFTIQVPGQNSLWSRKVMMRNSTGLSWNVLATVTLQNNTSASITLPTNTVYYVPYRYGTDFTCTSFPFNSLIQTANTQINGSTINCQAAQIMPVVRRVIQGQPEVRKRLACPTGVTGTSIISNARGTAYDEASVFCTNESSGGAVSNGNFEVFQFYDSKGVPIYTNADSSLPSMGKGYTAGTFYGSAGVATSTAKTLYTYNPTQNSTGGYPYSSVPAQAFDSTIFYNGSTVMLAIDVSGKVLPPLSNGAPVPVTVSASIPVYGSLLTMEPLLFPPFTYSDNEVAFTNVQSANVRLTMLQPNDRMARILRNIEAVGSRSDIPLCFITDTFANVFPSATATNNVTGFSTLTPQIDNLQYWLGQPGTNSTTSSPFNVQMFTNFLSPSLLEPIPETLVYPFLQYTPLVTTNGQLSAVPFNSVGAINLNNTSASSGILTSNIITLNTCPDMLALYICLDPTVATTNVSGASGTVTVTATTIVAGTAYSCTFTGTVLPGSVVTVDNGNTLTVQSTTSTTISFTAAGTITSGTKYNCVTQSIPRNPTYSYSDVLACITNVSVTWNNNASLLQNYLPSELLEVTATNGLQCSHTVGLGVANLPYKANVLNNGFTPSNVANTVSTLFNAQATYNTVPVGTIGAPILLSINKDLPTEAGTAAGVSGVYTVQVQVNTRFVDGGALPSGNAFQFFVTPIQTQYLQLIRGGTSAVVSAVAAADKMLASEYAPLRTLQAEAPYKYDLSHGHVPFKNMAGGANHAHALWNRAKNVYQAVKDAAPIIKDIFNTGKSIHQEYKSGNQFNAALRAVDALGSIDQLGSNPALANLAAQSEGAYNDVNAALGAGGRHHHRRKHARYSQY